jgi:folate-binding Fe-S cluster repair protein YgfZ
MGQEQASRVKFRGNPRRILKTLANSTQEIVKK